MEPNELTCQEVVALVAEYLEQTLLPEMQTKVDEHLAGCPGCTTYYEQMQRTIAMLRRLSQEPTLPETREALL
jgi:predicted anti-sigma-YlaC factor YlaD